MSAIVTYGGTILVPSRCRPLPAIGVCESVLEINANPQGTSAIGKGLLWHVGTAVIKGDGILPRVAGCRWTMLLLEGKGFNLQEDPKTGRRFGQRFHHCTFEPKTDTKVSVGDDAGESTVLNILTSAERVRADLIVHKLVGEEAGDSALGSALHLYYCAQGGVRAAYTRTGQGFDLEEGQTLVMDSQGWELSAGAEFMDLRGRDSSSIVIEVSLDLLAPLPPASSSPPPGEKKKKKERGK